MSKSTTEDAGAGDLAPGADDPDASLASNGGVAGLSAKGLRTRTRLRLHTA